MPTPMPFYDLKLSPAAIREINRVLKSGWLTTGSVAARFEDEVGGLLGVKSAAAVSSATSGITLSLKAAGVGPGIEVITTPFSFVAGVESILNLRAKPVFVDIDPATLNLNAGLIENRVTKKTRAILSVDIAGFPCEYPALRRIAKRHRIALVSDSAHALGSTVNGKSIPHFTDLSVYSFHATKNLTCGEGGMVVSRNGKLIDQIRLWSKHGMTASAYERRRSGTWAYDVTELGFKANMSDILAAVGLGELARFEINQRIRERLALRYIHNLSGVEELVSTPALKTDFHHAWHLFIVRLNLHALRANRRRIIEDLSRQGIGCSIHYRPIHSLSFARTHGLRREKLIHAEAAGQSVISLPLYPLLKPTDIDRVSEVLIRILKRHAR